jgi:PhoPQ-activated pathogenicity-related protein
VWTHDLIIFVPKNVKDFSHVLLMNTGGKPNSRYNVFALMLTEKVQIPVAVLFQTPNQPLFGKKREDALIAETFVRYLNTKDESWPLLFPMVKGVVKAMDTIQAFSQKEWKKKTEHFIITGSSKRGWTSWLTGAADSRVKAIAPMVIDTLNMEKHMEHQKKCYQVVSKKLDDYKNRGLLDILNDPASKKLLSMVDPYSYRNNLTMPKMIFNGTNDPYWVIDSLNLYWDGLVGDKYILYVPNAGHNLMEKNASTLTALNRAMNALVAFTRHIAFNQPMPQISWKFEDFGDEIRILTQSSNAPVSARLWTAESPIRDFRGATWSEKKINLEKNSISREIAFPEKGYKAFYVELEFKIDNIVYNLSTQVQVMQAPIATAKASGNGIEKAKEN